MTASIQDALQAIDGERDQIAGFSLPRLPAERLRLKTRVRAAYFSAWLDGNRLSAAEAVEVLIDGHKFPGRGGDILELKRTYQALEQVEAWGEAVQPVKPQTLSILHAILSAGRRAKPSSYRPDPGVASQVAELTDWLNQAEQDPAPIQAGKAQFEIQRIQPFSQLNARLGRALTDWVLYLGGYPLLRQAALAETLAADLPAYQSAIAQPDATAWLEYFTPRLAAAYTQARQQAEQIAEPAPPEEAAGSEISRPDGKAIRVLRLFETQNEIAAKDVMRVLGTPPNTAHQLLENWVGQGWLVKAGLRYRLSAEFKRQFPQILDQNR